MEREQQQVAASEDKSGVGKLAKIAVAKLIKNVDRHIDETSEGVPMSSQPLACIWFISYAFSSLVWDAANSFCVENCKRKVRQAGPHALLARTAYRRGATQLKESRVICTQLTLFLCQRLSIECGGVPAFTGL